MHPRQLQNARNLLSLLVSFVVAGAAATRSPAAPSTPGEPAFVGDVIRGTTPGSVVDIDVDITGGRELYLVVTSRWSGWGDWIEPVIVGRKGTRRLIDLPWKWATSGYGRPRINANVLGDEMRVEGKPVAFGIGVHSPSVVVFEIPAGSTRFKTRCGLDDAGHGSATFLVFVDDPVFGSSPDAPGRPAAATLRQPAPRPPDADEPRRRPPANPRDERNDNPRSHPAVTSAPGDKTDAFIEMIGGDRLPGVVEGYRDQLGDDLAAEPPHFVVRPLAAVTSPEGSPGSLVRVSERFVRRIVWHARSGMPTNYTPGRLYSREGATVRYRSAQFSAGHVRLLTTEGVRRVPFADIARLDLPQADPWEAYFDTLALVCPNGNGELIRIQTTDGLAATSSTGRSLALPVGKTSQGLRWWGALQPAWALDLLWFEPRAVAAISRSRPADVPLDRLVPAHVESGGFLARGGWRWRVNENVLGGPLVCAGTTYHGGYGVHADCELEFALPAAVESFRSHVGLDASAGAGGCVRARVYMNSTNSPPLYESPFIVGSGKVHSTGKLAVPAGGTDERTLILQVDSAHEDRPPDTDPLDIRDMCDWLEPQLQLDPAALRAEMPGRTRQAIAAWLGWEIEGDAPAIRCVSMAENTRHGPRRFVTGIAPRGNRLVLRREIEVDGNSNWLIVRTNGRSLDPANPTQLTIDIDGQTAAQFAAAPPADDAWDSPTAAVPLLPYAGRNVRVTVTQTAGHKEDAVAWSTLGISGAAPPLFAAWEDDGEFLSADGAPGAAARMWDDDRHSGNRSVRIDAGDQVRIVLPAEIRIRERPSVGEHRYLRFAFRKFGRGRLALGFEHSESRQRLARYDAGTGPPTYGSARRLWELDLPPEWIVQTVDVFEHFGELDIQAIELGVPDGDHALFDHIYFARIGDDFQWLPPSPTPEEANVLARRALARIPREKGIPALVAFDRGNGLTGTGTIVDGDRGHVVTAAHMVAGKRTSFDTYLADGRKVTAKRLGMNRPDDIGLLKIESTTPLPAVEIDFDLHEEYPRGVVYLALAHARQREPGQEPVAYLVTVRGLLDRAVRTDFRLSDCGRGGPLLDRHGRLIGVHTRRTGDSGEFLYTPMYELAHDWHRLAGGDVGGRWPLGIGPKLGVVVSTRPEGCQVTHVFPKSPAESANLQEGDWIRQLDAQSVASLAEIGRLLANCDPDDEVTLDIRREDRSFQVKLPLMQHRRLVVEEDSR